MGTRRAETVREGRSGCVLGSNMGFLSRGSETPTSMPEQRLVGGVDGIT